jgi:hypothetical protein
MSKNYPNCNLCCWASSTRICTAQGFEECARVYNNKACRKLYSTEDIKKYNFKSKEN